MLNIFFNIFYGILLFSYDTPVIKAEIDPENSVITGSFTTKISSSDPKLKFWLYPSKFAFKPPYLDDLTIWKLYPSHFSKGNISVKSVYLDKRKISFSLSDHNKIKNILLTVKLPEKSRGKILKINFRVNIPERYGTFGCINNRCFLGGPWYPVPAAKYKYPYVSDKLNLPLAPFKHTIKLKIARSYPVFIQKYFNKPDTIELTAKKPFFPLITAKNLKQKCKQNICLIYYSSYSSLMKYITGTNLPEVIKTTLKTFNKIKINLNKIKLFNPKQKFYIAEAPLRQDLSVALPYNTVFFAHKIFNVFPSETFLYFHRWYLSKTIWEAVFINLFKYKNPAETAWISDMLAIRFQGVKKSVKTFLQAFDFIPQIDNILRAPRMDFPAVYFSGVNLLDIFRDDFRRFNNTSPPGSTIYYKLVENIGKKAVDSLITTYLQTDKSFDFLLKEKWNKAEKFLKVWTNRYPRTNYAIIKFKRTKLKNTNSYEIGILRTGDNSPVLPVTVVAKYKNKKVAELIWDNEGEYHTFKFKTSSLVDAVEINPDNSILETNDSPSKTPKFDNFLPKPGWRYIFTGINALYNVTDLLSNVTVDMDFMPKYDLSRKINMGFVRNNFLEYAFDFGALIYFGPKIVPTRLAYYFTFGVELGKTRILEEKNSRGDLIRAQIMLSWNTRKSYIYPRSGNIGRIGVFLDALHIDNEENLFSGKTTAFLFNAGFFELPKGMVLGLYGNISAILGTVQSETEMLKLGGPSAVQGYSVDEFPGRYMGIISAELRHPLINSAGINLGGILFVNAITGALGISGGVISDGFNKHEIKDNMLWAAGMGYAIRFHVLWLGIYEGVFNFQFSMPLKRYETTISPYTFFVSVAPSF